MKKLVKKPTQKTIAAAALTFGAIEAGRRLSNGVSAVLPEVIPNLNEKSMIPQLGIVGLSLLAAASYNGPRKDIVNPVFLGMAVEQAGSLIDRQLRGKVSVSQNPNAMQKFTYGILGLGSPCGCQHQQYPALGYYEDALIPEPIEVYADADAEFDDIPAGI